MDDALLSTIIYKMSPKSYKFLSKIFCLPCRSTILAHLQDVKIKPGMSPSIWYQLKRTVETLSEPERYCGIAWDEMALTPRLNFDKNGGYIVGSEEYSEQFTTRSIATGVLIFMAIGIYNFIYNLKRIFRDHF